MKKEVIRAIETGLIPEIGLVVFLLVFGLILWRVFTMPKEERAEAKNLPLSEPQNYV